MTEDRDVVAATDADRAGIIAEVLRLYVQGRGRAVHVRPCALGVGRAAARSCDRA
jgi:hypothetical protein